MLINEFRELLFYIAGKISKTPGFLPEIIIHYSSSQQSLIEYAFLMS